MIFSYCSIERLNIKEQKIALLKYYWHTFLIAVLKPISTSFQVLPWCFAKQALVIDLSADEPLKSKRSITPLAFDQKRILQVCDQIYTTFLKLSHNKVINI